MREIVTLQFGPYANFVGSHFWNFQDELFGLNGEAWSFASRCLPSDILYRATVDAKGRSETYHPRLVLVDKSGSLGSWNAAGVPQLTTDLGIDDIATVSTWGGRSAVHKRTPIKPHAFQQSLQDLAEGPEDDDTPYISGADAFRMEFEAAVDQYLKPPPAGEEVVARPSQGEVRLFRAAADLDRTARYFTDYLKVELHSKSLLQLAGVWEGVQTFAGWGEGWEMAGRADTRDELEDRLRFFAEDCDSLQGFMALVDSESAFSGLSARFLAELADDYSKSSLLVYSLRRPRDPREELDFSRPRGSLALSDPSLHPSRMTHLEMMALNDVLEAAFLAPSASLYVPLRCPWRNHVKHGLLWDPTMDYQTSAVLATLIDTMTIPVRTVTTSPTGAMGSLLGTGFDLDLLVRTARGDGTAGNLGQLSAALPSPALEREGPTEEEDARVRSGEDAEGPSHRFDLDRKWTCFAPGCQADDAGVISESVVMRGCKSAANPSELCVTNVVQDALAQYLFPRMPRCAKRISVLPIPLPVPVTFPPRCFPGQNVRGFKVPADFSCVTRIGCSRAGKQRIQAQRATWKYLSATGEGRSMLDSWGHGGDEVHSVWEKLGEIEEDYERGEDDEDFDL